ncbi:MAG: hypothetical protein ACKO7W_04000, partial [Elainella sp.]
FPAGSLEDLDQINYSLTLASGKALNEIESDPAFFPITLPDSLLVSETLPLPNMVDNLIDADDAEKSQSLVELMAQIDPSPQNLQSLSDALSKLNIPVRLSSER